MESRRPRAGRPFGSSRGFRLPDFGAVGFSERADSKPRWVEASRTGGVVMRRTGLRTSAVGLVPKLGVRMGLVAVALVAAACGGNEGPTTLDRDLVVPVSGPLAAFNSAGQCFGDDAVDFSHL